MNKASEFISNPSNMSKELVRIVLMLNKEYEEEFSGKGLKRFKADLKLNMYLKQGYKDLYKFLSSYKIKSMGLRSLFKEFEKLYSKLLLNNFALTHLYLRNKEIQSNIKTKEDEKLLLLKKFYNKEISKKQFDKEFGHYAINAYELRSKRFEEYTEEELRKIAKLVSKFDIKEKSSLEQSIDKKDISSILISLRELAKYKVLFIIRDIRKELLRIQEKKNIKDIFDMSYRDLYNLV